MESEKIDLVLKEVIRKAREINIPVPDIISDKVIVNKRPKKRFGCCRKKDGMFFIAVSYTHLDVYKRQTGLILYYYFISFFIY